VFLALALDVYRKTGGMPATLAARRLFSFSLLYLTLLFGVLLIEHVAGPLLNGWVR
jgi:heme O synthase-like polyprenyltransferase